MRTTDFAPLYRSTVGFDRLFDLIDQSARGEMAAWPPYTIEKTDTESYRITIAVAGFAADEVELTQNGNSLLVTGQKKDERGEWHYLHRGIAARQFKQTFNLADHVKVNQASLEHGQLTIDLVREVPEALKPRRIFIGGSQGALGQDNTSAQVEHKAAA